MSSIWALATINTMMETVMMMMMWVCWHSSYIPSYAPGRGTRWYQETNLCLRSKVSSIWALTDLSISPPWRRDRQVILGKASSIGPLQTTRNKPLPARQIIFNHNRTFVLAFQPPPRLSPPPPPHQPPPMTPRELDLTFLSPHTPHRHRDDERPASDSSSVPERW